MKFERLSNSAEETGQTGFQIGSMVPAGAVIALQGPLGGGKTCFVQGIALGLGIVNEVVSPTYTLVIPYSGRLKLLHVDAYRIRDADELMELALEEELETGAVLAIEWFSRFENEFPAADVIVTFADGKTEFQRIISIESCSEAGREVVARLSSTSP